MASLEDAWSLYLWRLCCEKGTPSGTQRVKLINSISTISELSDWIKIIKQHLSAGEVSQQFARLIK